MSELWRVIKNRSEELAACSEQVRELEEQHTRFRKALLKIVSQECQTGLNKCECVVCIACTALGLR